ncbi:hypothetical protein A1F94_013896 [Pyrenophora tritici-repentis]|nr:hypothetical protein A1F94_013896 [Pyrenophora tritici-repentis]
MQQLWAQVLNIDADSIGLDDSFFRLGGDSIAAMKLVAEARKQNVHLTVAATFQHPRLVDLAAWAGGVDPAVAQSIVPFSLLNINSDVDTARIQEEVAAGCNIDKDLVEDIYPCSPLQEGLMSLTSKRAGDYIMQSVLELSVSMDESALRAAWEQVVKQSMMLRTRIVQHSRLGLLQVVVAGDIQWMEADHLGTYLAEDKAASMQPGDCLARYALSRERRWKALKAYNGGVLEERPGFNAFVQYLSQQDQEATTNYWQTTLAGCEATMFPPLPPSIHQPVANAMLEHQCPPLPRTMASDTTTSTLIRAAWAIVAGNYTSSDDVVFGATVTGRNAPVAGIEDIVGPAIATVPVRVRLPRDWTVPALLAAVQQQATEMIPYEQTGLQRIAKMGADAQHACGFQTLLIVQPADDGLESDKSLGRWQTKSELQDFTTYALMVQCTLATERVQITASFDPQVIEQWQLGFVAQQLAEAGGKTTVAEIDTLTPEDRQQLWKWNGEVPPVVERCVHELFVEQARARPDAAAICAWDGEMKYGELDELSSRLAGYLVGLGVGPEAIVPLCFEKSMWTVVAMLAVLKAGGAFAPLDPEHPANWRQSGAASAQHSTLCSGGNRTVVVVSEAAMRELPSEASEASTTDKRTTTRTKAQPDNPAYVLFTSGSTGKPKGVVIEHRAILTSCLGHGKAFNLTSDSRFLQFSSYTFDVSIIEIWTMLLKTAAAFIDDPAWLLEGCDQHAGRRGRLYKTGDLVYYNADGNLVYVNRKDAQVKCMPEVGRMAVEVIMRETTKTRRRWLSLWNRKRKRFPMETAPLHAFSSSQVDSQLSERLPSYMVPGVYFSVAQLPMTTSGKTDRKRLREIGATFSAQQLAELRTRSQGPKRQPSTDKEKAMQQLWAQVLNIDADSIGLDDSFFRLGGDSIAAMKLVAEARKQNVHLTVAATFQHPRLVDLAAWAGGVDPAVAQSIVPFSLLNINSDVDTARIQEEVAAGCNIDKDLVEDIYPCSPLQEGLMSLTSKRAGDYIMQSVLELSVSMDESALRAAWEQVVKQSMMLRTRIVQHSRLGLLQVVVAGDIQWMEADHLGTYLAEDKAASMQPGDCLARYALSRERRWKALKAYNGGVLEERPGFNAFVQYLSQQDQEATTNYWQTTLAGCEATMFPPLPPSIHQPVANAMLEHQCPPLPRTMASDTTTSTLIRAAWAIVAGNYTSSDDVVFGATVTGRNAPVAGIEDIVGPAIATVPVRVRLPRDWTVPALLAAVQQQATEMIPYEQTGLQRIAKMGADAQHACGFQTLLIVQPADDGLESDKSLGRWQTKSELQDFTTYALMVQCTLATERVQITASFDPQIIEQWQQLAEAGGKTTVAEIDTLTPEDRQQLWKWNGEVPPVVERCVHELFVEQARARPDAAAICAWDGEMKYGELDELSSRLAGYLVGLGVGPEAIVPLCFEKSMWTVVAMLAVLKAGGAFAPGPRTPSKSARGDLPADWRQSGACFGTALDALQRRQPHRRGGQQGLFR